MLINNVNKVINLFGPCLVLCKYYCGIRMNIDMTGCRTFTAGLYI